MSAKNMDVVGRSREQKTIEPKGPAGEPAPDPLSPVVCPFPAPLREKREKRGRYRPLGSKATVPQATNIVDAVKFTKSIGLPLVAHLTIHWSGTVAFDDHDGKRFAKVREGLNKILYRRRIPSAWAWCRECKPHTDIVHSHLLFHLPVEYRTGRGLAEMEAHLHRLVEPHGEGILGEYAVKLVIWPDPDGLYLIKGAPRCGNAFGSKSDGASRKASFKGSVAASVRTSVQQLALAANQLNRISLNFQ